jgi:dual 3',5'-cyclic-AMP and -GMP phosphodiesterase 11
MLLQFNLCVRFRIYDLYFIPQSFAVLSDKLEPLVEGVRQNKQHWLEIASIQNHNSQIEEGGEQ